jgi:hypothetical protein
MATSNEQLGDTGVWSGRLPIELDDPYHFDHPIDHLPGMALVCGLLDLVRRSGAANLESAGQRTTLSIAFPAFCELDETVRLRATRESDVDARFALLAQQGKQVVCAADLTVRHGVAADTGSGGTPVAWLPAESAVVHRRRPENVLVTGMATRGDTRVVAVRPPRPGHALAGNPYRLELLVDAARQFGTMICHVEHERPADSMFVMNSITVDVPSGLRDHVFLRWQVIPPGRGQLHIAVDVVAGDPAGAACGSVGFDYRVASPAAYRRLRGEVRAA